VTRTAISAASVVPSPAWIGSEVPAAAAASMNATSNPLKYDDNRKLLGSGAKFGNVSSGLARRFFSRGYERPYEEAKDGYFMELPIAAVVREVLGATGA
jgi:hypothetical protein